ncbi:phospholipase C-2 [Trichosporon asahii var. asahii CBS 8904]|uniref:Phospholipase C-2 n=1 Tax=Trichosporon asahii var. asahii (strain CBS 8904) TaxID=1220162 RepID=K1VP14_TRIAC|nr:phospholipase C-2 [Trichosporon asahii var. asahii CBS 8904]
MAIQIAAQGGVDVRGVNVNGGDHNVDKNGNRVNVNAVPQDTICLSVNWNGQDSQVNVRPIEDGDRQRGWRRLDSNGNVIAFGVDEDKIVLLPKPGSTDWMAGLPDDRAIADITIPGTHESTSDTGGFISQCQSGNVAQQLQDGIRFLDLRFRNVNGELKCYHGIQPMSSNINEVVGWINDFLARNPRETVVASFKQEQDADPNFPSLVEQALNSGGNWYFSEFLPTLGEVRGKAYFFSRFSKTDDSQFPNGQGFKPLQWPNNKSDGFEVDIRGTPCRIHDWYETGDIGAKANAITQHLEPTLQPRGNGNGPNHPYTLDYTSAVKMPSASPQYMASGGSAGGVSSLLAGASALFSGGGNNQDAGAQGGVNARIARWLLQKAFDGQRPRATLMMDFYRDTAGGDGGMAELLRSLNYINTNE